jgi:hypothetical protein
MKKAISRYDRLRALVRNPEFLWDLKLVEKRLCPNEIKGENDQPISSEKLTMSDVEALPKGLNQRAVSWFFNRYNLVPHLGRLKPLAFR